jgi:hypothetical protein
MNLHASSGCSIAHESAGKPDASRRSTPRNKFAQAFGVRPACRRFRLHGRCSSNKKRHSECQSAFMIKQKLLRAEDRVLGRFGDAELDDALSGNLDLLAGGRVATEAGGAVD